MVSLVSGTRATHRALAPVCTPFLHSRFFLERFGQRETRIVDPSHLFYGGSDGRILFLAGNSPDVWVSILIWASMADRRKETVRLKTRDLSGRNRLIKEYYCRICRQERSQKTV
jgi:hypothetical protein